LGGAYWGQGRVAQAEQAFSDCASTALKGGYVYRASSALCYVGMQQVKQAQLRKAEKTFRQALSLAQGSRGQRYPVAGYALVKLSELNCEWNHLNQARQLAAEGMELCTLLGHVDLMAEAYAALGRVQLAQADFEGLRDTLEKAARLSQDTKLDPWVVAWLDDCRVRLWLSTGDLDQAVRWVQTSGLAAEGAFSYHYDLNHITLARVMVAQTLQGSRDADPDGSLRLLSRLYAAADAMGWEQHKIRVLILQALVRQALHEQ
jgi:ATP/maltotriose-dependent transcriptional regulator MalT